MRLHIGKIKNLRVFALCFLALVVTPFPMQFDIGSTTTNSGLLLDSFSMDDGFDTLTTPEKLKIMNNDEIWFPSDYEPALPKEGVLDPVQVEQSGYSMTGNLSARTDTMVNTEQSLTIDTEHDWTVSTAQVEVTNLEKLYVVNGSFDEGNLGYTVSPNGTLTNCPNGWSAVSTNTDPDQVQQVSYEDFGERYVTVQNQAEVTNNPQRKYTHYAGTSVFWNQTFDVSPYTEDYFLSFSYLYLQGPITPIFSGNFSLQVFIDGVSVKTIDLPTLSSRGNWFETGIAPINIANISSTTMFMIGLVINSTFLTEAGEDYDLDGTEDGIINTQYITVLLDDISFISATPPSCEDVDLHFIVDSVSTPIIGSLGTGYGIIENPMNWQTSPLSFSIVSNTSISLNYNTILLNHRYLNSTPTTNILEEGVAYSISHDLSGNLEMFTYLGFLGDYENLTIHIYHPSDWQNFTVFDPFLVDVTSNCTQEIEFVEVPTSLLTDRLGWWKITCDIYNYATNASIQRFDVSDWVEESIFHTDDSARLSVSIGSLTQIPLLTDAVNFTWVLPNNTIWHESSEISGALGSAESTSIFFGAKNTTASIWCVSYFWSNMTELAYGYVEFSLHHQADLEVVFGSELDTYVGNPPVRVVMRFYDLDNGKLIINDGAVVTSTWTGGIVDFEPDLVKNWWQAEFDTALVGVGNFVVTINSSAPFYETVPKNITIKSQHHTNLDSPSGPLLPLIYGRSYNFDFFYSQSYDGLGIDGALVEITEEGSDWVTVTDYGNGNYNITLTPLGERDYSIRIFFSKVGYENQTFVLSFLVEKVPIMVDLISSLSGSEFSPIDIEIAVVEIGTLNPVREANVTLSIVSSAGTIYALQDMIETDEGHYVSSFSMPPSGEITFNLIIQVEKENYEMEQEFQYTLVPQFDAFQSIVQTIMGNSWQIIISASMLVAVVVGQRTYVRKNRRKYTAARAIKTRFNDANNLLGIIVLHKLSGVPIYSKMMKVGFEEGMLSAFITAIMHFRSEFETSENNDEYHILPISDIIRAVSTPNLLCAFITVSSASPEQEEKMIGYARAIGMMMDETLAEAPTKVIDAKTAKTLEWLFDDFVDGGLLRKYQIGEKDLPRSFKVLRKVLPQVSTNDTFKLKKMIRGLENCGLSEDEAYLLILDAIDNEHIVPIYPYNDFPDTDIEEN